MQRNALFVFQQDNACPHVAAANVNVMHGRQVPVEHILDELGRRVRHAPRTVNGLANVLFREWNNSLIRWYNYVNYVNKTVYNCI
jgi:hypothetical protein